MKYMLLIYEAEIAGSEPPPDELQQWFAVTDEMQKAGVMVAGDALQPTPTATTVRAPNGRTVTSDGPFAETKEQLGGYYIIDVPDLDEAVRWAGKMPNVGRGSIEVRPVMEFDQT
ncbi:MAG: YciI family protein [Longimicrobiales bacterium]